MPPLPSRGPAILLVDDEPEIRRVLGLGLRRAMPGLAVVEAGSGQEALALLERIEVDVVVSDYRMPGMDGLELLARAARIQPGAGRVLMTAHPDLPMAQRAINESRVDRFLVKPFAFREALEAVQLLLGLRIRGLDRARALAGALASVRQTAASPTPPAGAPRGPAPGPGSS